MSIATFIDEFKRATTDHPLRPDLRVWEMCACFEVSIHAGHVGLDFIQALFKGHGDGSRALDWFVALARKHDVAVKGRVQRCGAEGLPQGLLRVWYANHGFRVKRNGDIELAAEGRWRCRGCGFLMTDLEYKRMRFTPLCPRCPPARLAGFERVANSTRK